MLPLRTTPKLYIFALDAAAKRTEKWRWRAYRQDGNSFKEIDVKDYPRSIAIMNVWRPNDRSRYATGMKPEDKIGYAVLGRELNPENGCFGNSCQAMLGYMLETENNLEKAEREFTGDEARKFPHNSIAKHKPVRLTSMEMTPMPKAKIRF